MYYELYIDILFLENLILDYLLLRQVRLVLGLTAVRNRLFPAAVLGSGSFCILCMLSVTGTIPGVLISCFCINVLMVKFAFPMEEGRVIFGAAVLLYICGLLFGGVREWMQEFLGFQNRVWELLLLSISVLMELPVKLLVSVKKQKAVLCPICVLYKGKIRRTVGLLDTGNCLYDPLYRKPVSIVERSLLEPEISKEELLLTVPYRSVGNANGRMKAVVADYMSVCIGKRNYVIHQPVLGLSEDPLSGNGFYRLILNPGLLDK